MPSMIRDRLYWSSPLECGVECLIEGDQHHYLTRVLRLKLSDKVRLFNAQYGEWSAEITSVTKKATTLTIDARLRPPSQPEAVNLTLFFAPIKNPGSSFYVQKATELGVMSFIPVATRRTIIRDLNLQKLNAIAIEATEQCDRLTLPTIAPLTPLSRLSSSLISGTIFFCDEAEQHNNLLEVLLTHKFGHDAILIGPEGGFDTEERHFLSTLPNVKPVSLGTNILRAETAMIAALSTYHLAQALKRQQ